MSSSASTTARRFWTVSFSGAGMLLPYHLGVARVLRDSSSSLPIRAVAGSSSGAIAAALFSLAPHRLEEYCDEFLSDKEGRGARGLTLIRTMLSPESLTAPPLSQPQQHQDDLPIQLFVCTTKSVDGSMHLFQFDTTKDRFHSHLLPAIHASCTIPKSFHPFDVFSRRALSYPDGIEIDGELHCDGGISAPAPPVPSRDPHVDTTHHIVVSPISSPHQQMAQGGLFIRPKDTSLALPFALTARCGSFQVRPSLQNLHAMFGSIGATTSSALWDWHSKGEDDAHAFLELLQNK